MTVESEAARTTGERVARSAGIVGLAVMGSRVVGLLREQLFAWLFGAGLANDAFVAAFRIPNLLRDLFAEGALSAAFVSTTTRVSEARGTAAADELGRRVTTLLFLCTALVAVVGMVLAPALVDLLASGFRAEPRKFALTVKLTRMLFPMLTFVALAAVAMGILNTRGRFGVPASASTAFNVVSVVSGLGFAYLFAPQYVGQALAALWVSPEQLVRAAGGASDGAIRAMLGMGVGTLLGAIAQWLVQVPSLGRVGFRFWPPQLSLRDPDVREVLRLMGPAALATAAVQVNVTVNTQLASHIPGDGPLSWLSYAFRLMQLPIGIFGVALMTASAPEIARAAARDDKAEMRKTLGGALRLALAVTVPASVGLWVLGEPIISVLYRHGSFGAEAAHQTARALSAYAIGLWAYATIKVVVPTFYALGDSRTPLYASLASIGVNYAVARSLVGPLGHVGLALAVSSVAIGNLLVLALFLRRRLGGFEGRALASSLARVLLASAAMGAAVFGVRRGLFWLSSGSTRFLWRCIEVGAGMVAGVAVVLAVASLLRVPELATVRGALRRRLRGRGD